jgi:chemotaxis signal transduction protein
MPVPSKTPFVKAVARREKEVMPVFDLAQKLNVQVQGATPLSLVVKHEDGPMVIRIDEEIPVLHMVEPSAVQPYSGSDPDIVATFADGAERIPIYSLAKLGKVDAARSPA